jgi:hypothetical protein
MAVGLVPVVRLTAIIGMMETSTLGLEIRSIQG